MPLPHWHPSNPPTLATLTTRLRQRHTLVHALYRKGQPTSSSDHLPKTFDNKQWTRLKRIDTEIGTGKFDHSSFASAELDLCYASDPLGYGRVRVIPKGLRLGTQRGQERLMKVLENLVNGVTLSPSSSPSQSPLPSSPSVSPSLSHPPPHTTLSRPPHRHHTTHLYKTLAEWDAVLMSLWTSREHVFEQFLDGHSVEWIANTRGIRSSTVRSYIRNEADQHGSLGNMEETHWRRWLASVHPECATPLWNRQMRVRLWGKGYRAPWKSVMGDVTSSVTNGEEDGLVGGYEGWVGMRDVWWRSVVDAPQCTEERRRVLDEEQEA